jgi:hypothetical protein
MNTDVQHAQQYQIVTSLQLMMESANAAANIFAKTMEDALKLQFESGAQGVSDTLPKLVPTLSPEGAANVLWNIPTLYQEQAQRTVDTVLQSYPVLSRGQHELVEWACQALSNGVKQFADVLYRLNGMVVTRRVTAQEIDFADRRTMLQLVSGSAQQSAQSTHSRSGQLPSPAAGVCWLCTPLGVFPIGRPFRKVHSSQCCGLPHSGQAPSAANLALF